MVEDLIEDHQKTLDLEVLALCLVLCFKRTSPEGQGLEDLLLSSEEALEVGPAHHHDHP